MAFDAHQHIFDIYFMVFDIAANILFAKFAQLVNTILILFVEKTTFGT